MSLDKMSITWTANEIRNKVIRNNIDFNHIVQRSYVWEPARKTALIESMILGYPIPPIFTKRMEMDTASGSKPKDKDANKVFVIMDGKQRLSTVSEYLEDKFALTKLPPVSYIDKRGDRQTEDISGLKFSGLSESLQNIIETFSFDIILFDDLTKEEERELFKRLNAGKPLSSKTRSLASCNHLEEIIGMGSHRLFEEMLTDKSRDNKNQVAIIMKIWCMMNKPIEEVSFESRIFNPLLEAAEISEDEKQSMIRVFDLLAGTHAALLSRNTRRISKRVAKKMYTETHMVSLVPFFCEAVKSGIDAEKMADWLTGFFETKDTASASTDYNEACAAGSAKNVNIIIRNMALRESFESFFEADEGSGEGAVCALGSQGHPVEEDTSAQAAAPESEEPGD